MKRAELVAAYFNSQITEAEENIRLLQQRVRFRRIDLCDAVELMYAMVRYEVIKQACRDVSSLLHIDDNNIK